MPRKMKMGEECECCSGGSCSCGGGCKCASAVGGMIFLLGLAWLGAEMSWWNLSLPWLPLVVVFFGLSMAVKGACKGCCR